MRLWHNFNSHAHVERDAQCIGTPQAMQISTHTLTWSVTSAFFPIPDSLDYFNSHAHVERDYMTTLIDRNIKISTHTLTWSVTRTM